MKAQTTSTCIYFNQIHAHSGNQRSKTIYQRKSLLKYKLKHYAFSGKKSELQKKKLLIGNYYFV